MKTAKESAVLFVDALRAAMTPEQFATMQCRNAAETIPGVCHSHDFVDANEVMAAAVDATGTTDAEIDRMNAAWEIARPLLRGESLFAAAPESAAHAVVQNETAELHVAIGGCAVVVPLSDYAALPRDVSFSFWCSGREFAAPVDALVDTESHDAIAAQAFDLACTWPTSAALCDANDDEAVRVLKSLHNVDGWKLQPADHRGMNLGGAELSRELSDGECVTVGLYCCEFSGQWIVAAWNGRTDAGNAMTAESFDTPAAEHGGDLCSDDALRIVRDTQARLVLGFAS